MYKAYPSWVTGFHGCDQSTYERVLHSHQSLNQSQNEYDWLGHGIYFWENNPLRAYEFALEQKERGKIDKPMVIGAMLDLKYCLDFTDMVSLTLLQGIYPEFENYCKLSGVPVPQNKGTADKVRRNLDCAVIEFLHSWLESKGLNPYDSVRGAFFEGKPLYDNSAFNMKNHIQLCIRDDSCIKGYFSPRIDVEKEYQRIRGI